jgi:hypothetical protein
MGDQWDPPRFPPVFTLGNADWVVLDLANDADLYRATISFSLFHVGTGAKAGLWKGVIANRKTGSAGKSNGGNPRFPRGSR